MKLEQIQRGWLKTHREGVAGSDSVGLVADLWQCCANTEPMANHLYKASLHQNAFLTWMVQEAVQQEPRGKTVHRSLENQHQALEQFLVNDDTQAFLYQSLIVILYQCEWFNTDVWFPISCLNWRCRYCAACWRNVHDHAIGALVTSSAALEILLINISHQGIALTCGSKTQVFYHQN